MVCVGLRLEKEIRRKGGMRARGLCTFQVSGEAGKGRQLDLLPHSEPHRVRSTRVGRRTLTSTAWGEADETKDYNNTKPASFVLSVRARVQVGYGGGSVSVKL